MRLLKITFLGFVLFISNGMLKFANAIPLNLNNLENFTFYPEYTAEDINAALLKNRVIVNLIYLNDFSIDKTELITKKLFLEESSLSLTRKATIFRDGQNYIFMSGENSEEMVYAVIRSRYEGNRSKRGIGGNEQNNHNPCLGLKHCVSNIYNARDSCDIDSINIRNRYVEYGPEYEYVIVRRNEGWSGGFAGGPIYGRVKVKRPIDPRPRKYEQQSFSSGADSETARQFYINSVCPESLVEYKVYVAQDLTRRTPRSLTENRPEALRRKTLI